MSFSKTKQEFDDLNLKKKHVTYNVPYHIHTNKKVSSKRKNGDPNEDYYRAQFIYALIKSDLYPSDQIGVELYFPKGNKNSADLQIDAIIFSDNSWFDLYKKYIENNDLNALVELKDLIIFVFEFKDDASESTQNIFTHQLQPALSESSRLRCLGAIYNKERLFLFDKNSNNVQRLDISKNKQVEKTKRLNIDQMNLHIPDSYNLIPSLDSLLKNLVGISSQKSNRTFEDIEQYIGISSANLTSAISNILVEMQLNQLVNENGYRIFIQCIALKMFDESKSRDNKSKLQFYIDDDEKEITSSLSSKPEQKFIKRMKILYDDARAKYVQILGGGSDGTINWSNYNHIKVIRTIVQNFQDYSLIKSSGTDLWQIIFYVFGPKMTQNENGQHLTPLQVIDFIINIVNPKKTETIVDPTCGTSDFLASAFVNKSVNDENLFGIDNDPSMIMLSRLNMLLNGDGNATVTRGDSLFNKLTESNVLKELSPSYNSNGNWNKWPDGSRLKKFDIVLTNPPFGKGQSFKPKDQVEKDLAQTYEVWNLKKNRNDIDLGCMFLENTVRLLKKGGRFGIVLSSSIVGIDEHKLVRDWLLTNVRVVALIDLPVVFLDTSINTSLVFGYIPKTKKLNELQDKDYEIFANEIEKPGYEVKSIKKVKTILEKYKIDDNQDLMTDDKGTLIIDEEFTSTYESFVEWCESQESELKKLFL